MADDWLLERFTEHRAHLRRVAQHMLGSASDADDAVQEAWLRMSRASTDGIENIGGWLTTVVARVCLDQLRSRTARRETVMSDSLAPSTASAPHVGEAEALLGDAIAPALLVVLQMLSPAERVAFVLHEVFDLTFEEIAPIVGRSAAATRQLGSRARRRIRLGETEASAELDRHHAIVKAFLAASRGGDLAALLSLLDPNVVLRADDLAVRTAAATRWAPLADEMSGAQRVAETLAGRANGARLAKVDGFPGAALFVAGQVRAIWLVVIESDRIVEIELCMDPERLGALDVIASDAQL